MGGSYKSENTERTGAGVQIKVRRMRITDVTASDISLGISFRCQRQIFVFRGIVPPHALPPSQFPDTGM
jgi:hypothetical protein